VRACQLDQAAAVRLREGAAAGILERRDRIDETRPRGSSQCRLQRVEVHAVVAERDGLDIGAEAAEDLQRAVVTRRLHEDPRARLDVMAGDEVEGLEGAVRDHDALDVDVVAVGDPPPQRQVAERRPVVQRRGAVARERSLRALAELVDRKQVGAGNAPGKGDQAHGPSLLTAGGRVIEIRTEPNLPAVRITPGAGKERLTWQASLGWIR
jgi:hypothetical protein